MSDWRNNIHIYFTLNCRCNKYISNPRSCTDRQTVTKYHTYNSVCDCSPVFLPPAYVVRGKVIFILGNVCLFTIGWGGGDPIWLMGRGVPNPRSRWGGVPHPADTGSTPSQVQAGGYPIQLMSGGGYPIQGPGGGYQIPGPGRGYPRVPLLVQDWMGYPPVQDWMGYPPPHCQILDGYPLCPRLDGYPPAPIPRLDGIPPCPWLDGVPPTPSGDWSAKRALATRRAVCLLRSRKRTFLFFSERIYRVNISQKRKTRRIWRITFFDCTLDLVIMFQNFVCPLLKSHVTHFTNYRIIDKHVTFPSLSTWP